MTHIIRPSHPDDIEAVYEMAKLTGGGFTNLPPDRDALTAKLESSARAFAKPMDTGFGNDLFMLMLEDAESGKVLGTCQIFSRIGGDLPFYSYRIATLTTHSRELNRTFRNSMLNLITDLEGSSEVGGLFLHPNARAGGLGLLLARSRYLFIAMHRPRFGDRLLAELRGTVDAQGNAPFWDGVAGRFFGMSFREADEFNALHGNHFIADLMPRNPIYVNMISEEAREAIALPHESGRPAMRMLEAEGFAFENYVDIFDGGPTMIARTDQVKTIAASRATTLATDEPTGRSRALIAAGELGSFRCAIGTAQPLDDGTLAVDPAVAQALRLAPGDALSWAPR